MTAPLAARSPPPNPAPAKRAKLAAGSDVEAAALPFHSTLLDPVNIHRLQKEHETSAPYKHAVINQLFEPEFLKKARQEIVEQISFREKETDICERCMSLTADLSPTNATLASTDRVSLLQQLSADRSD